jgi:hypothetical protein
MKRFNSIYLSLLAICFSATAIAQSTDPDPSNNVPCPNDNFPCCETWNACNGPYYGSWSYDPDFASTGFCDLACTPIDSGVLFLLLGGAAFGGMMIMRRRQEAQELIKH